MSKIMDIEGVFIIDAKDEEEFHERKEIIREETYFSGDYDYEEDEDGGCWKLIVMSGHHKKKKIRLQIELFSRKYDWFYLWDSMIYYDGEVLYSSGRWYI